MLHIFIPAVYFENRLITIDFYLFPEGATGGALKKRASLKILQISQEKPFSGVSFQSPNKACNFIKRDPNTGVFL